MVWWKDEVFCDKQTNQQTERLTRNTEKEIKKGGQIYPLAAMHGINIWTPHPSGGFRGLLKKERRPRLSEFWRPIALDKFV